MQYMIKYRELIEIISPYKIEKENGSNKEKEITPLSIDWKRHERQKECPQGVVIGSYSNFKQRVQS